MPSAEDDAPDVPLPSGSGSWAHHDQQPPDPDPERVQQFLGRTLLIGVSYQSHDGQLLERKQFFGPITEITRKRGIVIHDEITDADCCLPPDLEQLHPAKKGNYTLKASGRVITDPDYTTQWFRTAPALKET
jgi:hypothetical protein